jgi:hypothetical protein
MANNRVRIGHASISERGTIDGNKGDTTQKEVCTTTLNLTGWGCHTVLRPNSTALAEASARICEAICANDNVGYSQYTRNTLFTVYQNGGLAGINSSNKCNTDCSAFMTFCAVAGGARFPYWRNGNAPVVSTMKNWFTQYGDYTALTDQNHRTNAAYLRRGDVLLKTGHTVMCLGDGSQSNTSITWGSSYTAVSYNRPRADFAIKMTVTASSIETTKAVVQAALVRVEDNIERPLTNSSELGSYKWSYSLASLEDGATKVNSQATKVSTNPFKITLSGLAPDRPYILKVTAEKNGETSKISSPSIIFSTLPARPAQVRNLTVGISGALLADKNCTIAFNEPNSWGTGTRKGYRISLVKNGQVVAHDDSLISAGASRINKSVRLRALAQNAALAYNDTVQIGVQAWTKDSQNNLILDSDFPTCSQPVQLKSLLSVVDKLNIKVGNTFKRAILYNNKRV